MMAARAGSEPIVGTRINSTPMASQATTLQCQTPRTPQKQASSTRLDARGLAEVSVHKSGRDAQDTGALNQEIAHLRTSIH
jgi:hypothetical protein